MARDYLKTVAALRRKAHDKATPEEEKEILLEKARQLEKNHPNIDISHPYPVLTPEDWIKKITETRITESQHLRCNVNGRMYTARLWNGYPFDDIIEYTYQEDREQSTGDGTGW